MDQRERYEEYLQDESDEQFSIYSVSHFGTTSRKSTS